MVQDRKVTTPGEAASVAAELGFPVVMKVLSADVAHKTEAGGVRLGVGSAQAAAEAFEGIVSDVAERVPGAKVDGVIVSPQISGGVEMILGVNNDPTLGPVVMVGLGGVLVEVLKDFSYRRAPFGPDVAREMVSELRGYPLLTGVRGAGPSDVDALCEALSALSVFAAAHAGSVESVDINPFVVHAEGRGAVALDALITRREAAPGADGE
jgi:acyl-CoA synthetase (NDP forming)